MTFKQFFTTATGGNPPYDYQLRLAEDSVCQSRLIEIPTGLGKTAAVVLAWLWNRVVLPSLNSQPSTINPPPWPRRLVYCLPMRTLVEQTAGEVKMWVTNLLENANELGLDQNAREGLQWLVANSPIILMGGEDSGDWDIHPERGAILIGTQDMLLSRALNRGYGMSRYRWPMHFALLNNDALWVMDETQLMGVTVETSAQLDGFRHKPEWSPNGVCPTWWMSATLDKARLATVDHPEPAGGWKTIKLSDAERASGGVQRRFEARKPVAKAVLTLSAANKKDYGRQVAALISAKPRSGLTLVVVNRVARAQEIYAALTDKKLKLDPARIALIHSRFRPVDRARHTQLLFGGGDRIVVATQAVEAGVDVSARLLLTELAPWSSLVQRFGRCNREGKQDDAEILWIDVQLKDEKDDLALPYAAAELRAARIALEKLADAGSRSLAGIIVPEPPVIRPVLRRRDLIDLFDTTPDLCGQDLDISRYIRDGEDSDVQVYWRAVSGNHPPADEPQPVRAELCRGSIGEAKKFLKKEKTRLWRWDPLAEAWEEAKHPRPGAVYLADAASGGYSDDEGWTGDPKSEVTPHRPALSANDAYGKDRLSFLRHWQELDRHTAEVVAATDALAASLQLEPTASAFLHTAAQWHDLGKAHEKFQDMLSGGEPGRREKLWAKSGLATGRCERRGFRHELASALAWLLHGPADAPDRDLIAYLIAAHHGKVRLSIRALPDEKGDLKQPERLFARGVWHDEELLAVALPGVPSTRLPIDLTFMHMGESRRGESEETSPSWLARMIALRDRLGPFRLAYLETLLRAADIRASAAAAAKAVQP